MALKVKGATAPAPERDTHFELATSKKDGTLYVRATTYDGKKFRLVDITPAGLKLRSRNNHPNLGVRVNAAGQPVVS